MTSTDPISGDLTFGDLTFGDLTWRRIRLAVLLVYAITVAVALWRHAMWIDEMQAWLIARDSPSLTDLFRNIRYEGHPALWFLCLWLFARLSADPVCMQVLHGALAICTIALVLWRAPFMRAEKLMFPFGYFSVYEYAVKSRSYALGLLLVAVICAAWPSRRSHPIRLALLLALLANVHVLFMLMSAAFLAALGIERLRRGDRALIPSAPRYADLAAIAIVLAGWAAAFATAWPPLDSGYAQGWFLRPSFVQLQLATGLRYWSTPNALGGFALVMAGIGVARARRDLEVAAFLALAIGMILGFLYAKYTGYVWHRGVIFSVVIASAWLSRIRATVLFPRFALPLFLAAQLAAGLPALVQDVLHPLSAGRAVATFIKEKGWGRDPMIGVPDFRTSTILGYLQSDRAFYPYGDEACRCRDTGRWGSFAILDRVRLRAPDDIAILDAAERLGPSVMIVLPLARDASLLRAHGFALIKRFTNAAMHDETFALYRRPDAPSGVNSK